MKELKEIFRFGWPYLRRYRARLFSGILLGILFGLSNASFLWATKTLFERLDPDRPVQTVSAGANQKNEKLIVANKTKESPKKKNPVSIAAKQFSKNFNNAIDPWLPKAGRDLDFQQILGGLLFLPILIGLRGSIGYLSSYCMSWVSERVVKDLRLDLLIKLNSLSLDFFNRSTIGEILARVNGDTNALYRCLSLGFSDLIKEPVTIIGIITGLLWVDWKLTLLAMIFVPLTVIPIRVLGKKARKAVTSSLTAGMTQDSLLVEVFSSIRIVKAFCLEDRQVNRFRKIYDQLVHIGMKTVQAKELVNPIIEVISMLGLGIIIIFIFKSHQTVPKLVGFLTGIIMLYTPIKKLGGLHVYFQQASVGAGRLIHIFREQQSVKENPQAEHFAHFTRQLSFENVSFSYGAKTVLKNISIKIPHGTKLGLAGESGSGKSTLVNLIFRFYDPTHGAIKIDGKDLRELSVFDLRQQMALVSQEVIIFDQSVAENIACGKLDATAPEIEAAARAAHAHEFIMHLPRGYETRVGERGVTLSGGQRQRLAIARAFIRNAPILVLDEATASLDSQSEAEVQVAINRLSENRTVICVAHRLSTLANTDEIIVLSQGKIIEQGSFEELLRTGGAFANMAKRQGIFSESHQLRKINA